MTPTKDNNPNGRHRALFTAHVGIHAWAYSSYLGSYEEAVEVLYRSIAVEGQPPDTISIPLLYLMRHTLELGHKFTLYHLHKWLGKTYVGKGHDLKSLHDELRDTFTNVVTVAGLPPEIVNEFDDLSKRTLQIINALAPVDFEGGQASRYPISTKNRMIDPMEKVNLLDLKDQFDAGMTLLLFTADVVGDPPSSE